MADVVRVLKVAAMVVSDEEIAVDKMIAASQRRGDVALPSEGRLLVPYFVPGSSLLTEDALNMNTDVDAFRRDGASILDIPMPLCKVGVLTAATNRSQRRRKTSRQLAVGDGQMSSDKSKVRVYAGVDADITFNADTDVEMKFDNADQSPTSPLESTSMSSPEDSDSTESSSKAHMFTPQKEPRTPGRQINRGESLSLSAPGSITDTAGFTLLEHSIGRKKATKSKMKKMFSTPSKGTPLFSSVPSSPEVFAEKGSNLISPFLVLSLYEKWAGPAYAKSPPACSLPLPRFHLKPETTPKLSSQSGSKPDLNAVRAVHLGARSAPVSPTQRDRSEQKTAANNQQRHASSLLIAPLLLDEGISNILLKASYPIKDSQPASVSESSGIATSNLKKMLQLS